MKRSQSYYFLIIALFCSLHFASCSEEDSSSLDGLWSFSSMEDVILYLDGNSVSLKEDSPKDYTEMMKNIKQSFAGFKLKFHGDKCTFYLSGQSVDCSYEIVGNRLNIGENKSYFSFKYRIDGDHLKLILDYETYNNMGITKPDWMLQVDDFDIILNMAK